MHPQINKVKLGELLDFMKMTHTEVLQKFMTIEGAYGDGKGDSSFVYIPGTRKDRVLMVAHADTVFGYGHSPKIGIESGVLFSMSHKDDGIRRSRNNLGGMKTEGTGIGADDRAGCAIIWKLRELGHSILITSGEEIGQIAAHAIMKNDWWKKEIAKHQFAIQFDRRGHNDIVFYNCGTDEFEKYAEESTGYSIEKGSRTDICVLCEDICGVNISVGYYNEHTKNEILVIDQWFNTYLTARKWLSSEDIPKFKLEKKFSGSTTTYGGRSGFKSDPIWEGGSRSVYSNNSPSSTMRGKVTAALSNGPDLLEDLKCNLCKKLSSEKAWANCAYRCPKCSAPLYAHELD